MTITIAMMMMMMTTTMKLAIAMITTRHHPATPGRQGSADRGHLKNVNGAAAAARIRKAPDSNFLIQSLDALKLKCSSNLWTPKSENPNPTSGHLKKNWTIKVSRGRFRNSRFHHPTLCRAHEKHEQILASHSVLGTTRNSRRFHNIDR